MNYQPIDLIIKLLKVPSFSLRLGLVGLLITFVESGLFFVLDLIQSEILSKSNLDFLSDDLLLHQLSDGPLKMEDVSFDYFNLPNTLEYLNQQQTSSGNPSGFKESIQRNNHHGPSESQCHGFSPHSTPTESYGYQSSSPTKVIQERKQSEPRRRQEPKYDLVHPKTKPDANNGFSYQMPVGMQNQQQQVSFGGRPAAFVLASQAVKQQPQVLKLTAAASPKTSNAGNKPVVTVPITSDHMQQVTCARAIVFYKPNVDTIT